MARAHRIGQKKVVNVYRFVSKDTIEEEIIERAKRKMVLEYCIIKQMDTSGEAVLSSKKSKLISNNVSKEELQTILKFGAQNLFKQHEESTNNSDKKLEELNLDEILARAERTDPMETASETADGGASFLEQWQVADIGVNQISWEDLIPEEERKRQVDEDIMKLNYELMMGRKRTQVSSYATETGAAAALESKTKIKSQGGKRKRAGGSSSTELCEKDLRSLYKSILRFGDPSDRFEAVFKDADLEDELLDISRSSCQKMMQLAYEAVISADEAAAANLPKMSTSDKKRVAEELINKLTGKSKMVPVEINGQQVNSGALITRTFEMRVLNSRLKDLPNTLSFRIPKDLKAITNWNCSWSPKDDAMLLVGIYRHGFGSWDVIQADKELGFENKFFLGPTPRTTVYSSSNSTAPTSAAATQESTDATNAPQVMLPPPTETDQSIASLTQSTRPRIQQQQPHSAQQDQPQPIATTLEHSSSSENLVKTEIPGRVVVDVDGSETVAVTPVAEKEDEEKVLQLLPKSLHLNRRAEYLLKFLKDEELKRMAQEEKQLKKKGSKPLKKRDNLVPSSVSAASVKPGSEPAADPSGGDAAISKKKRSKKDSAKAGETSATGGGPASLSTGATVSGDKSVSKPKKEKPRKKTDSSRVVGNSNKSSVDQYASMDELDCKEKLRPVRHALKGLKHSKELEGVERVKKLKECLTEIGDFVRIIALKNPSLPKLEKHLWKFASHFWPADDVESSALSEMYGKIKAANAAAAPPPTTSASVPSTTTASSSSMAASAAAFYRHQDYQPSRPSSSSSKLEHYHHRSRSRSRERSGPSKRERERSRSRSKDRNDMKRVK